MGESEVMDNKKILSSKNIAADDKNLVPKILVKKILKIKLRVENYHMKNSKGQKFLKVILEVTIFMKKFQQTKIFGSSIPEKSFKALNI